MSQNKKKIAPRDVLVQPFEQDLPANADMAAFLSSAKPRFESKDAIVQPFEQDLPANADMSQFLALSTEPKVPWRTGDSANRLPQKNEKNKNIDTPKKPLTPPPLQRQQPRRLSPNSSPKKTVEKSASAEDLFPVNAADISAVANNFAAMKIPFAEEKSPIDDYIKKRELFSQKAGSVTLSAQPAGGFHVDPTSEIDLFGNFTNGIRLGEEIELLYVEQGREIDVSPHNGILSIGVKEPGEE
jgi:hypothetical protein